jgi:PhzF family phenazine biosynthesis protein
VAQPIVVVDAFTDRRFAGNPAAVCVLDRPAEESWMQSVAAEMNHSETSFLHPESAGVWRLRWFTPLIEVDLCGHATLAAAHVLWETGHLATDRSALFDTRSGRLSARRDGDWIELDFPAEPVVAQPLPAALQAAIGPDVNIHKSGQNRMDWLIELDDEAAVRAFLPDFAHLARVPARGLIATARSDNPAFDFVSRFFAPRVGINEDPVCGSAHCALGPHWATRLGKPDLIGHQISRRTGVIRVRVRGPRVHLAGHAVTTVRAELA